MRSARKIGAMVLLAATLTGSTWLYLYREPSVAKFIDARGSVYHLPYTMYVQPWWSVFAAVLLLALGTVAVIWVMPDRSRVLRPLRNLLFSDATDGGRTAVARVVIGLALLAVGALVTRAACLTARAARPLRVAHTPGPLLFR